MGRVWDTTVVSTGVYVVKAEVRVPSQREGTGGLQSPPVHSVELPDLPPTSYVSDTIRGRFRQGSL